MAAAVVIGILRHRLFDLDRLLHADLMTAATATTAPSTVTVWLPWLSPASGGHDNDRRRLPR